MAEEVNIASSASKGQGEAVKTKKIPKVQKDPKRCEPENHPVTMLRLKRPVCDTGAERDEIGSTLSLEINQTGENLQQNLDLKQNLEDQAEENSLLAEFVMIKSSQSLERDCSFPDELTVVEMADAVTHGSDSLQLNDSEVEDLNLNEDMSRYLPTILEQLIIMRDTDRVSVEMSEKDEHLEMATSGTTNEYARAVDSSEYRSNDYTDTGAIPVLGINSDPDVLCRRESVKDQAWNNLKLERNENGVNTSKLNLEAAECCSNVVPTHVSYLDQIENAMYLSSSVSRIKESDHASDVSCLDQIDSNINASPVMIDPFVFPPEMDQTILDQRCILGHDITVQNEEYQQRQASVHYSGDPKRPRENKFICGSKIQNGKLKETLPILNKKKSLQKSEPGVSCRLLSLQRKRKGQKRNVKLKKNMESAARVRHAENFPGILSDLKVFLHQLTTSFAQGTAPAGAFNKAAVMRKKKQDFATELGIVLSEKKLGSQGTLIDDFLLSLVSLWFIFPTIKNGLQSIILLPVGLQLYFEKLLRGSPPEEREKMSYEWLRLQTFINYPSSAPGSGIRLAQAGFYYSGNGTVTVCYACGGQHSGWNFHDDPYEIHRRISPDCPFLRRNPTYSNVPIMQDGAQIGIQMGNNASNMPISPSSSNRRSGIPLSPACQSQMSTVNLFGSQTSTSTLQSIHNSPERGLDQRSSEQTLSEDENYLGVLPHPTDLVTSTRVDEIPSVINQSVTITPAVFSQTIGEYQERQLPTTAATTLTQQQQLTDCVENTQHRSPGNFVPIGPIQQLENPEGDPIFQILSEQPRHPEYALLSSRVNSYTGWPAHLDQTPQQMAEAGFFYAGTNDHTSCFHCGGGLWNWDPGDNPWTEHARCYPQCAYVLDKRGQRFVNDVLRRQVELSTTPINNRNTVATIRIPTSSGAISKTCTQSALEPATQPGCFQNSNEIAVANRLINEMGYQRERIREAILEVKRRRGQQDFGVLHVIEILCADEERRARSGRQNEAAIVEELIQESGLLTLHDDSNTPPAIPPQTAISTAATQPSQSSGHLNQVSGNRSSGQRQIGQKNEQTNQTSAPGWCPPVSQSRLNVSGLISIAVDGPPSSSAFDAESLREENLRLRNQTLCKLCMDRNVELVFLPCGHLACCEVCGQTLRFCLICRAKIHTSVKTYLS